MFAVFLALLFNFAILDAEFSGGKNSDFCGQLPAGISCEVAIVPGSDVEDL